MMHRLPPSCARGYDVDASFMSLELHERGIHAVKARHGWSRSD
jgi:hypothetical protein